MFQTRQRSWPPPLDLMTRLGLMALLGVIAAITWLAVAIATRLAGLVDDDGTTHGAAGAIMALTVYAPSRRATERRYVLDLVLREWLGLEYRLETREGPRSGSRPTATRPRPSPCPTSCSPRPTRTG